MRNFVEEYGEEVVRSEIRVGLAKCTEPQRMLFKRIYANGDLKLSIEDIVKKVKDARLNHALAHVNRTLIKNAGLYAEYDDSDTNVIDELTGTIKRLKTRIAIYEDRCDWAIKMLHLMIAPGGTITIEHIREVVDKLEALNDRTNEGV